MKLRGLFLFALGLLLFSYPLVYLPAGGLAQAAYLFAAWGLLIALNWGSSRKTGAPQQRSEDPSHRP